MAIGSFKLPNTAAVTPVDPDAWIRPTDWLSMPTIGTQEFIGLLAITDDDANHIALACAGAYTVDWGDGTSQNIATGVVAQHSYTYSAISAGTLSTRGYKQVLVRVTPQAGQNLTAVSLQQQNSILAKVHVTGWLDVAIKGSNITSLAIGGSTVTNGMLENVDIYSFGSITSLNTLFNFCYSLQKVNLPSTASVTNFSYMFQNCIALRTIPLFSTVSGTNFEGMFNGCLTFRTMPLLDTSAATNMSSMFTSCTNLTTIPLLNTVNNLNFSYMFQNCYRLESIPLLDTAKGTNFSYMFAGCQTLTTIPLINTINNLNASNMFNLCYRLQYLPLLNTGKVTNFSDMFPYCLSLQQLPNFNTALGTNFTRVFGTSVSITTSLAKGAFQGTRYAISYNNMCLSQSAIVDIFNGLGTAVGAQTITVTNNPGRAALTAPEILIATAKGFTVV